MGKVEEKIIKKLRLSKINTEAGTQMRVELSEETLEEYRQDMEKGYQFPELVVFSSRGKYYLADGFHRHEAAKRAKIRWFSCEMKQGSLREAKLYAAGANAKHGLRRTNEDKRKAVIILLKDKEWSQWSAREIARQCAVSNKFVSNLRRTLSVNDTQIKKVKRGDKVYAQNTQNIGKTKKKEKDIQVFKFKSDIEKKLNKYCSNQGIDRQEALEYALKMFFESLDTTKQAKKR